MSVSGAHPGRHALTDAELEKLSAFLNGLKNPQAMSLETLDGFFCALAVGPETVMPSEYLPVVWGGELPDGNAFASLDDANATLSLLMRHWNSILTELETDGVYGPLLDAPDQRGVPGCNWARGFMRGVGLRKSVIVISARTDRLQLARRAQSGLTDDRFPRSAGMILAPAVAGKNSNSAADERAQVVRNQAFAGATSVAYPVLNGDFVEYVLKRLDDLAQQRASFHIF
jgi:hypothetical protein